MEPRITAFQRVVQALRRAASRLALCLHHVAQIGVTRQTSYSSVRLNVLYMIVKTVSVPSSGPSPTDRLDSWKEIASYLRKGVRTVQRWEREERLPIHRLAGNVFAYQTELDAWWHERSRSLGMEIEPAGKAATAVTRRSGWPVTAAVLVVVTAAAFALVWRTEPTRVYRPVPLTSDHGWEVEPSFSPDGERIAYTWRRPPSEVPQIYVRRIAADSAVRLTSGTGPEVAPAWSPGGNSIAFLRLNRDRREAAVMLVPPSGAPESRVAHVSNPRFLNWSPDGRWLISTDGSRTAPRVVAISIADGTKHTLTTPSQFGDSAAVVSPDSRKLIFRRADSGQSAVFELALGPGLTPRGEARLISRGPGGQYLVLTPDGREIIYAAGMFEEGLGLWRLRLAPGAQPELIHSSSDRYLTPSISRDGRRLAFGVNRVFRSETWRASLTNPAAAPVPLISSTHSDVNPDYSPDGRHIAFHSTRSGASDIWVTDDAGQNARRLTFTNAPITATPRWSPDGQWIVFESDQSGQYDVYVVRSAGGPVRRLTDNPALDALPNWARDGRTIYFCSNRSGAYEVWKTAASGGEAAQVTRGGGVVAVESRDGRYLYYTQTRNAGPLYRLPLSGGPAEAIIPFVANVFYAVTTRGIYFQSSGREISFWDAGTRQVKPILTTSKPLSLGMTVSPDGQWLLFTQIEAQGSDLYMIDGFR
jgi:Tol biopolymer transport system component